MVMVPSDAENICDFVKGKPRTIQEISEHIQRNWRTAERYVEKIIEESGRISSRIFRKGTRGALKIVYWNSFEDLPASGFQKELLGRVLNGIRKSDFSPFEVYQHLPKKKKSLIIEDIENINEELEISSEQNLINLLKKAKERILFFSGNLSWVNAIQGNKKVIDVVRELAEKGVTMKVVTRVSMIGAGNVQKLLAINKTLGKDIIEVRHSYQPLRAVIIDNKVVRMKEIREPGFYSPGELKKRIALFYTFWDEEWVEWMEKIFWKMFSVSPPVEERISEIEEITKSFPI
jgi:hypothetical protein